MILAIDPSLTNTAVIRGDQHGFDVACFGSEHRGDGAANRIERCRGLVHRIKAWVGDVSIDAVFIEGYAFSRNDAFAKFSAEYGGLLRAMLVDLTKQVWEISPSSLKKFADAGGKAKKELVVSRLNARYGVRFDTHDEYDAFALYRLGLVVRGLAEPVGLAQAEVHARLIDPKARRRKKRGKRSRRPPGPSLF